MTDINLLPLEQRGKESKEEKKRAREKSRLRIELTLPTKKEKSPSLSKGKFWFGFTQTLKRLIHDFSARGSSVFGRSRGLRQKSKPPKPPKLPSPSPVSPALSNKHLDDIQIKEKKKFFYQPVPKIPDLSEKLAKKEEKEQEEEQPSQPSKPPKPPKLDINLIPGKIKDLVSTKQRTKIFATVIIICLLIAFITYLFLAQLLTSRQTEIKRIDRGIQELTEKINNLKEPHQEVNEFVIFLKEVKQLIEQHVFASQLLTFIQENTLKEVAYSDMRFELGNMSVSLTTKAKDYKTLAEQLLIFQSLEEVVSAELNEVKLKEVEEEAGKKAEASEKEEFVTFNITLKLKPEVVYRK